MQGISSVLGGKSPGNEVDHILSAHIHVALPTSPPPPFCPLPVLVRSVLPSTVAVGHSLGILHIWELSTEKLDLREATDPGPNWRLKYKHI